MMPAPRLSLFRGSSQERPGVVSVEIKSAKTVATDFFRGLRYWMSLPGNSSKDGILVYGGEKGYDREGIRVRPWHTCS